MDIDKDTYKGKDYIIAGIDPSLTGTAIIIMDSNGKILEESLLKTPKNKISGMARLSLIKNEISKVLKKHKVNVVAIESYSYASVGQLASLGELGGVIRLFLYEGGYKYYDVPPTSLKSFITENGKADKDLMKKAIKDRYKLEISDDNIADAFGLARMTLVLGEAMPTFCSLGGAKKLAKLRIENKKIL